MGESAEGRSSITEDRADLDKAYLASESLILSVTLRRLVLVKKLSLEQKRRCRGDGVGCLMGRSGNCMLYVKATSSNVDLQWLACFCLPTICLFPIVIATQVSTWRDMT
jgi:hypothetical protein